MARTHAVPPALRRRQILDAAQNALTKKHFRDLTMDDVARIAGISKGSLYLYFKDKDALFAEVTLDVSRGLSQTLAALPPAKDPYEGLSVLINTIFDFGEQHREFVNQFVPEQLLSSRHAKRIMRGWMDCLAVLSRRFLTATPPGTLRIPDPERASYIFIETLRTYMMFKYIHHRLPNPLKSYTPEIVDHFLFGWSKRPEKQR